MECIKKTNLWRYWHDSVPVGKFLGEQLFSVPTGFPTGFQTYGLHFNELYDYDGNSI